MKIVHCADIHLGSKIEAKLPYDKMLLRRNEVRAAFSRMVEYARKEKAEIILISGDLFDSDRPLKKDKEFFYSIVKSNPEIDFIYLRGNHDSKESYTENDFANLKCFNDTWNTYEYHDLHISGIEISPQNEKSFCSTLKLNKDAINIVMLHGQIGDEINLLNLKNKNIDYLALGHIHTHKSEKIDERGIYSYSGCLEGRGFDELGAKGFILLDLDENRNINSQFIENSKRVIEEISIDISNCKSVYEAYQYIKEMVCFDKENLYKINITGNICFDKEGLKKDLEKYLENVSFFLCVKDKTSKVIDIENIKNEISLKGEFVRTVMNNNNYDEETKQKIIDLGLKALTGQEVEI